MQFSPVPFPPRIALGAQRKTAWSTTIVATAGGFETAIQNWSKARHAFDLSFAVRTAKDYELIVDHFHAVRGRAKKYLFKDILDYRVEGQNGILQDDGNSPSGGYLLFKRYGLVGNNYDRRITRPKEGTVGIYRTRAGATTDITSSATITYDGTGTVSIDSEVMAAGDEYSWAGQFWVPARYDTDELPSLIVNRQPAGDLLVQCQSIPVVEVRE